MRMKGLMAYAVVAIPTLLGVFRAGNLTAVDYAGGIALLVVPPVVLWLADKQQQVARQRYAAIQDAEENDEDT